MAKMLGRSFRKGEFPDCQHCCNPKALKKINKRRNKRRENREWRLDTQKER